MRNDKKEWKHIDAYPNYIVSNDGIVKNDRTGRILKQCDNNKGYPTVNLYNAGGRSTRSVHSIVAELFVDGRQDGYEVNHKNGDKHDNNKENLEWVTRGENENHAYKTGLKYGPNHKSVRIIETGEIFSSIKACARSIKGCEQSIRSCLDGKQKTHLGLTFEYANKKSINMKPCDDPSALLIAKREPYRKPVRIIETGEIYPGVRACAQAIGGDQPTITGCLKGRHKTHRGYHYEFVE